MAVFALSSCSEDDNTVDEYANWQERNEQAFEDTLAYARQQIANGSTEWKVIRKWSLQNQTPNKDVTGMDVPLSYKDADHIVVRVLKEGKGSGCPTTTSPFSVTAHIFLSMPELVPRLMVRVFSQSLEFQPMM